MRRYFLTASILLLMVACSTTGADGKTNRTALAERFFRGVYGCDPSVVDELAADDVVISYAIFDELFGTPALRGREAVSDFAAGFCKKWTDARITIHETVEEQDKVVLVWSFQARNVGSGKEHRWGGISFFRFDEDGKIVMEMGEESDPGPIGRVGVDDSDS